MNFESLQLWFELRIEEKNQSLSHWAFIAKLFEDNFLMQSFLQVELQDKSFQNPVKCTAIKAHTDEFKKITVRIMLIHYVSQRGKKGNIIIYCVSVNVCFIYSLA